jgi:hypothetical protein
VEVWGGDEGEVLDVVGVWVPEAEGVERRGAMLLWPSREGEMRWVGGED